MCLENAFQISEVVRPSLHEELMKGEVQAAAVAGARVFVAAASEAPPKQRLLREGADGETSLAQYWLSRGWQVYADHAWSSTVRQVLIQHGTSHGTSVLSYPADQVWRLAAAVDVSKEAPKIMVNPRQLLSAEPGYVLLSLDYSQIELRLMAHFSADQRLLNILHQGGDVFKQVAAGWLGKSSSDITPEERSGAKRICYSLIYGVGSGKLAADLGISRYQANELKASFMKEYAGVAFWITSCTDQARQQGFVETVHGRRRFLPGLGSSSAAQRSHAERQAVNTACQASAADLMKAAMIGIHNRLKELRSHASDGQCRLVGRLLLQIHDELMVEESRLTEVREVVVSEMIRAGLGNLSHWHDDLREYEDEFALYQGLNCLEEEVEEQTTCWILQDADEDDIAFAARAGSAGDVTRQRPASMPDLPNLMKSRAPQAGLEKVTKAGRRAEFAPSRQGEGPVDSAGQEPDDPQGELDTLLAECQRMSAGMSDF
eukprot:s2340_g5.t1